MSISDTASTSSSSSANEFNFNVWIEQNNLSTIKQLFIKHQMYLLHDLSMQSKKFGRFIADAINLHPTYVQQVVNALQQLHSNKVPIKKIRATDEEFAVEELIDNKLNELNNFKQKINELHYKYVQEKKIQCENMKKIENEIENEFNKINIETNKQKTNLNEKLSEFSMNIEDILDNKIETLTDLINKIEIEIEYKNKQLNNIRLLLDNNNNMKRHKRKQKILKIGNECKQNQSFKQYEKLLNINDLYNVNVNAIGMFIDKKSYDKILKYLKKVIKLNINYNNNINTKSTREMEGKSDMSIDNMSENMNGKLNEEIKNLRRIISERENDIKILKHDMNKLNETIQNKDKCIEDLNIKMGDKDKNIRELKDKIKPLNKKIITKKTKLDIMNEKYNRIKTENVNLKNENRDLKISLNEEHQLLDKFVNEKYNKTKQENVDLKSELNKLNKKLCVKRDKIKGMEKEIMNINSEGKYMNIDWEEQIQQCLTENDHLRSTLDKERGIHKSEMKVYKEQISNLQRKIKDSNNQKNEIHNQKNEIHNQKNEMHNQKNDIHNQKEEIHKLRREVNEYRIKLSECNNNMKGNGINNGVSMAMRFKNDRRGEYKMIVKGMGRFNGNNGKQFVDKFCKLLGKEIEINSKHVNNKGKDGQMWYCFIKISGIGLSGVYSAKQKKNAINGCYKKVANLIEGYRK